MHRLIRWGRRFAGAFLLAWSAWTIVRPFVRRPDPLLGVAVGAWGERYELRIRPLTADETRRALEAERDLYTEAWRELHPDGIPAPAPLGLEP